MKNCSRRIVSVLIFTVLFSIFSASCQGTSLSKKTLTITKSDGTTVTLKAEIADTFETRQKGFMFRKNIPDGTGMLFIFESDQILHFWMKNTPHPLSIAYISSNGKIRDIFDMKPYDLSSISSTGYVRYALEVPQGWYKKAGISTGDYLSIDFN